MSISGDLKFRRYREVANVGLRPPANSPSLRNGDRVLIRVGPGGLPVMSTLYGPPGARAWFEETAGAAPPPPPPAPDSPGLFAFADFFALMPADNAATVAPGASLLFPQDGPNSEPLGTEIARTGPGTFQLGVVGTYRVSWQVSVDEGANAAQLMLGLNGGLLADTVVGRATGTNQLVGDCLITTVTPNAVLTVLNPPGNAVALTITPIAGGFHNVSAHLVIERLSS